MPFKNETHNGSFKYETHNGSFKYETHLHTCEGSGCASASGAEQARRYKELGYDGIIVTDHFFNGNCAVKEYKSHRERVEKFCKGYENARAEGEKIGLKVFFGFEYTYDWSADLLVYGVDGQWIIENEDVCEIGVAEFCERVHRAGGLIVHAHPFREWDCTNEIRLLPKLIDAVEVHNCGNTMQEFNDRARWYAMQFGKPMTAGTDNHHLSADKISGVISKKPLNTVEDYIDAVINGGLSELIIP